MTKKSIFFLFACSVVPLAAQIKPVKIAQVKASSQVKEYPGSNAVDGKINDASRWVSEKNDRTPSIELQLAEKQTLAGIHVYSGFGAKDAIAGFSVQFNDGQKWITIPAAVVSKNRNVALSIAFDATVTVTTDRLKVVIDDSKDGVARVKEIVVWPAGKGDLPPIAQNSGGHGAAKSIPKVPLIYLNQSGFNIGKPKRFTAPTLPDGTAFVVRAASGGEALHRGVIQKNIGDFSEFNPISAVEYVVQAGEHVSVPFRIGHFWLERVSYQNAVNFMIDSRHHVGNDRNVCGGSFGWRDDHHFGWELHTLVPQYLSNPSAYQRMPSQVRYEKPKNPKLWGALEPYRDEAPDLVKLIHWGADVIVTQKLKHEMIKSQLAYFLYAWPVLAEYLPEQNFQVVSDYAFSVWDDPKKDRNYPYDESPEHNLLALKKKIGSTKGCLPPGFSVQPNLMMYEVAKRMGRSDANRYFDAAKAQVDWMIQNLDWNHPQTTKGQRMSEFLTITGMAHFLQEYPDQAPRGLQQKIEDWADVIIRRSNNFWDFRKLDDKDGWTPMGDSPQKWNEPGNVIGLPSSILAALPYIKSESKQQRLRQIVWSHFDQMFGRNPSGLHFSYDAPREVEGVEFGWYKFHVGGIGRLAEARFVIDGSCKNAHYPYHPEVGDIGWTEGWIQFNCCFNISLSYLAKDETKINLKRIGKEVLIQMHAPLNFDEKSVEKATVMVSDGRGKEIALELVEDNVNARTFSRKIKMPATGKLQVRHGYGYLASTTSL
jgi:hypothetical protein